MNLELDGKILIYEVMQEEFVELLQRAVDGSILKHERESLMDRFVELMNANTILIKDISTGHMENQERLQRSFDVLSASFNMLAEVTGNLTGKEIPRVKNLKN